MPLIRGVIVLVAALAGLALFGLRKSHHGTLDRGIWYWHTPFRVAADESKLLKEAGIGTIYVHAGTFTTDGNRVLLRAEQKWETPAEHFRIVPVFSFDPGTVRHFEEIPETTFEKDVGEAVGRSLRGVLAKGIDLSGVQLDFDCPTRLLRRYSQVLKSLRKRLAVPLSITALPTWISSSGFPNLANSVDFVVPQFYEGRVDRTLAGMKPIGDPAGLKRGLATLDRLGVPYRVGLPAYGHAVLFDDQGRLAGMYRDLSVEDALRHPSLRFKGYRGYDERGSYVGEDMLQLEAIRPGRGGKGLGWSLVYDLPSPDLVAQQSSVVDQDAGQNCLGTVFYRFPEAGETTCLPLTSIVAALRGRKSELNFDVAVSCHSLPYALIGAKSARVVPRELTLSAKSVGNVATAASPTALRVLIRFDKPGLGDILLGDFDAVRIGTLEAGQLIPCGRARANALELRRFHVLPGQKLSSGSIELLADGPTQVSVSWSAEGMGRHPPSHGASSTEKLAELTK